MGWPAGGRWLFVDEVTELDLRFGFGEGAVKGASEDGAGIGLIAPDEVGLLAASTLEPFD